jgi:hypothetical protein
MQDSIQLLNVGDRKITSQYAPYQYWDVRVNWATLLRYLQSHNTEVPNEAAFQALVKYVHICR